MEKKVKNIINELLALEPSLKGKEDELKKVIEAMIYIKPNIDLSPDFRDSLKKKLEAQISSKIYKKKAKFDYAMISKFIWTFIAWWALIASAFVFGIIPNNFWKIDEPSVNISTFMDNSISDSPEDSFDTMISESIYEAKKSLKRESNFEKSLPMLNSIVEEKFEVQNGKINYIFDWDFDLPKEGVFYEIKVSEFPFVDNVEANNFEVTLTKKDILDKIKGMKDINYGWENLNIKLKNPVVKLVKNGENIISSLVFYTEIGQKKSGVYQREHIIIPLNEK